MLLTKKTQKISVTDNKLSFIEVTVGYTGPDFSHKISNYTTRSRFTVSPFWMLHRALFTSIA